jgi:hypothetical protein
MPDDTKILNTSDVGRLLQVSRVRARYIVSAAGFPEPIGTLQNSGVTVWDADAVVRWGVEHGRLTPDGAFLSQGTPGPVARKAAP